LGSGQHIFQRIGSKFPTELKLSNVDKSDSIGRTVLQRVAQKRFALCYRTVVLSCLSVTLVHCGQTVGWMKMKLGMQVGLVPGHIVLDGDPAPLPKGAQTPNFRSISVVAKWPRPRRLCVRWGPSSPPHKKGAQLPIFGPCLLWPNGRPSHICYWFPIR